MTWFGVRFRGIAAAWLLAVSPCGPAFAAGLELQTLDGAPSSLAAQVKPDRFTLVMVWTTYCQFCKQDYPEVSAFHDAHVGRDAEVIGISLDGYAEADKVRAFIARKPFTFPTVIAEPEHMADAFEKVTGESFTGTPTYLMFDRERKLVAARSGDLTREVLENFIRKHGATE
ncbi:MAG: TlpA family protein disulfide reductase [Gammaproteobacteria bacterium]